MITPYHYGDLSDYSFLVTGGAGFIGSNLVEYLLTHNAKKVLVLDNLETGSLANIQPFFNHPSFTFIEGDIVDPDTCVKASRHADIILHQAALGSVPRSIKDPAATNKTNIDGFLNMLIAARQNNVQRFVYAASSSTYGDSTILPKKEDVIGKPLSPYAVTKYVNELYADVFSRTYGIETVGLRYFNVFGPKQSPEGAYAAVIPRFIMAFLKGEASVIEGDGNQTRDFTYIENVIQANIKAATINRKEAVNQIYNVAVGESTSIMALFQLLKELSGSDLSPRFIESRVGDVRDSLADIAKASNLIGYNPDVRFADGLRRTYNWFKTKYNLTESE